MQIKKGVCNKYNTKNFLLRTLCGKGVDLSGYCSTNLRLDQDIVKLFETHLRLEKFLKNILSEVGEVGEKSRPWLKQKRNIFVWNFILIGNVPDMSLGQGHVLKSRGQN